MRFLRWLPLLLCGAGWCAARADDPSSRPAGCDGRKENLEIPPAVDSPDRLPEEVSLFGESTEGNAIIIVLDQGSRMAASGGLERAKRMVLASAEDLESGTELALVLFGTGVHRFPRQGGIDKVGPGLTGRLAAWLACFREGCGTTREEALREARGFHDRSQGKRKVVVYLGVERGCRPDRGQDLLKGVLAENREQFHEIVMDGAAASDIPASP